MVKISEVVPGNSARHTIASSTRKSGYTFNIYKIQVHTNKVWGWVTPRAEHQQQASCILLYLQQ